MNSKFKIQNSKFDNRHGFTLGEILVAMTLFIAIISIASGTFVQGLRGQRAVISSASASSNAASVLESIAREIRTGYDFRNATSNILTFINSSSQLVNYKLLPNNSIGRCAGSQNASCTYSQITSDKVFVTRLSFIYSGIEEFDGEPPRVTISLGVRGIQDNEINFQTTISAREIDS